MRLNPCWRRVQHCTLYPAHATRQTAWRSPCHALAIRGTRAARLSKETHDERYRCPDGRRQWHGSGGRAAHPDRFSQYIKDLSFENPGAPSALTSRPNIELGVDLSAKQPEKNVPLYEVDLKLRVDAKLPDGKPVLLLELSYAGLLQIENIPSEVLQQVLLIEGPHLL